MAAGPAWVARGWFVPVEWSSPLSVFSKTATATLLHLDPSFLSTESLCKAKLKRARICILLSGGYSSCRFILYMVKTFFSSLCYCHLINLISGYYNNIDE